MVDLLWESSQNSMVAWDLFQHADRICGWSKIGNPKTTIALDDDA